VLRGCAQNERHGSGRPIRVAKAISIHTHQFCKRFAGVRVHRYVSIKFVKDLRTHIAPIEATDLGVGVRHHPKFKNARTRHEASKQQRRDRSATK
jgi:hypothetical protein